MLGKGYSSLVERIEKVPGSIPANSSLKGSQMDGDVKDHHLMNLWRATARSRWINGVIQ